MKILLDTHILLWAWNDDPRLTPAMRRTLATADRIVSAVTVWEMTVKRALGKLALDGDIPALVARTGCQPLAVTWAHAATATDLPRHHGDPFDRLLIAQAQVEALPILTADPVFRAYGLALA